MRAIVLAGLALLAVPGGAALAQSVQVLGDYRAWSSYSANDGSGPICFAASKPTETSTIPDGYGEAFLYVTHRPAEGVRYEINVIAGYEFAVDSIAIMRIGSNSFDMYTTGDAAWLADPTVSSDVAGLIRAGSRLEIEGSAADGTRVVQTFSLSGATAAQRAIDSAC